MSDSKREETVAEDTKGRAIEPEELEEEDLDNVAGGNNYGCNFGCPPNLAG